MLETTTPVYLFTPYKFCPFCSRELKPWKNTDGRFHPRCAACKYVQWGNPRIATRGLLGYAGEILLVLTPKGWACPGGISGTNEITFDTVDREFGEETNLKPARFVPLSQFHSTPPGWANFMVSVFAAVGPYQQVSNGVVSDDPRQLELITDKNEQLVEARFFGELPPNMAYPQDRVYIDWYRQGLFDRQIAAYLEIHAKLRGEPNANYFA